MSSIRKVEISQVFDIENDRQNIIGDDFVPLRMLRVDSRVTCFVHTHLLISENRYLLKLLIVILCCSPSSM